MAGTKWTTPFEIIRKDAAAQIVFGWFSVIEKGGLQVLDTQGDAIDEDELEKASFDFMLNARRQGEMHEKTQGVGRPVASIVFTHEIQEALGIDLGKVGWFGAFKVDDPDTWKKIESGELGMFSIGGSARRVEIDDDVELAEEA